MTKQKGFAPVIILVVTVLVIAIGYFLIKQGASIEPDVRSGVTTPLPTPSQQPDTIVENGTIGWKLYSGNTFRGSLQGSPKSYQFSYPDSWALDATNINYPFLVMKINNKDVGRFIIDAQGHGGSNNIVKNIRSDTEKFTAGSVEITETLDSNNNVVGTFWFVGTPNNAPLQPIFGFEFDYQNNSYKQLKPLMTQILNSVVLSY